MGLKHVFACAQWYTWHKQGHVITCMRVSGPAGRCVRVRVYVHAGDARVRSSVRLSAGMSTCSLHAQMRQSRRDSQPATTVCSVTTWD